MWHFYMRPPSSSHRKGSKNKSVLTKRKVMLCEKALNENFVTTPIYDLKLIVLIFYIIISKAPWNYYTSKSEMRTLIHPSMTVLLRGDSERMQSWC